MELIDIESKLFIHLEEAKQKKKECWREDVEDEAYYDGEIYAYQKALNLVKEAIERKGIINNG